MDKTPNDFHASVKVGGDQPQSVKGPFDPKAEPNLYQILNLEPHANRLQIREAYIKLKSAYEQGSAALYSLIADDEAKLQLSEIEFAYHCLSDEVSRRTYDLKLGLEGKGQMTSPSNQRSQQSHQGMAPASSSPRLDSRASAPFNSERLVYAQETLRAERLASFGTRDPERNFGASTNHSSSANSPDYGLGTIQTNRSTLPVVKLKAENSDSEAVHQQMQDLLATSDLADGELYKKLREIAGVAQDEMQDRTKISVGYLLALESNRLDRLPQAVYVKGFLRSYFRYINAPQAEAMVDAFAMRLSQWQTKHRS
jgi:curved DNA-binding protein CbpA